MPDPSQTDPLLTLKVAAKRLNVHPSTLRRWADQGAIPVVITPGGHRRFPKSGVEQLAAREGHARSDQAFAERAMTHTRSELAHQHDERWMANMAEEDREAKRMLGQRVMGLMMQYISRDDEGEALLEEACVLGQTYAKSARVSGLSLADALKATMFFRDNIVESAVVLPEAARARPDANRRLLRRINTFLNAIQLAITDAYQES